MGIRSLLRTRLEGSLLKFGFVRRYTGSGQTPTDLERTLRALDGCGLRPTSCIDVGAHTGGWTRTALARWPDMTCVLMEPQADLLEEAERRLGASERLHLLAMGAGPRNERAEFYHHARSDSSSFRGRTERTIGVSEVEVQRIDRVVDRVLGGRPPDILKLDCEGWDLEVLKGAGECLGVIPVIFLEVGMANPRFENTLEATLDVMRGFGYRLFDVGDAARNPNGALWNAEVCFVRIGGPIATAAGTWAV